MLPFLKCILHCLGIFPVVVPHLTALHTCMRTANCLCPSSQAALELTEAQQVDMMYLRMLFYAKLGALSRQRKELLRQASHRAEEVPTEDMDAVQAASRLAATGALAQQLHDNSAAEFKTYMQLTSAYRRGVSPTTCDCTSR